MSEENSFEVSLYSPRWGHEDVYKIRLERDQMTIEGPGIKKATCSWRDNQDPEWSGHRHITGNPLINILEDDHIYPPKVFVSALEHAWKDWRNDELSNEQIEFEVITLCEWLNAVTQNKPKSDYWRTIF